MRTRELTLLAATSNTSPKSVSLEAVARCPRCKSDQFTLVGDLSVRSPVVGELPIICSLAEVMPSVNCNIKLETPSRYRLVMRKSGRFADWPVHFDRNRICRATKRAVTAAAPTCETEPSSGGSLN
jgi:hypothetical protein